MQNKSTPTPLWLIAALGAIALGGIVWFDMDPRSSENPENLTQAPANTQKSNQAASESELPAASLPVLPDPNSASVPLPPNPYDPAVLGKQLEQIVGTDPETQAKQLSELRSLSHQLYLEQVAASSRAQQQSNDSESNQNAAPEEPQAESAAANDSARTNPYAELQAQVPTQTEAELREQRALSASNYLETTRQHQADVGGR